MLEINPAQQYASSMDSVTLINRFLADPPSYMSEQDVADTIQRNVKHLEIMVGKDFWTDEDLTPFTDAIAAGQT
jgi:hypothetical protein